MQPIIATKSNIKGNKMAPTPQGKEPEITSLQSIN